jgi:hypothetical protein
MKRGWLIAEIAAWTLFFPIAIVLVIRRQLGYGWENGEARVAALLEWYPAPWRARHGERFSELLRDTFADGRGGLRMRLDVAREGVVERRREFRWEALWASFLIGLGSIMVLPQGIVAPILGLFDAPRTWFLALYFDGEERWLVVGGMIGIGLLLIDRGIQLYGPVLAAREEATAR